MEEISKFVKWLILALVVACGVLAYLYQNERTKNEALRVVIEDTRVQLKVCQIDLKKKPQYIIKRKTVEVVKYVDQNGNVVSSATATTTIDEPILITPNEIIKEVVKEAPEKRFLVSLSVPATSEGVLHLNIQNIGVYYQPFKKVSAYTGFQFNNKYGDMQLVVLLRF